MKLKVVVFDFEIPPSAKKWALRAGIPAVVLCAAAVAFASPLHTWANGQTLQATDLNDNFANLQQEIASTWTLDGGSLVNANANNMVGIGTSSPSTTLDVSGPFIRQIARAHGNGPNETTANGAIPSRKLQYTKTQAVTGLRITWEDNLRCYAADGSCEWEIKIDGGSCATPGPLAYDIYDGDSANNSINIHRPESHVATCFGISAGPHVIQVYVTAPASNPTGGAPVGVAGVPFTGWNAAYWSLEVEEVY
jgi:hypothetical protein